MSSKATITAVAIAAVVIVAAAAVVWTSGHGNDGGNTDPLRVMEWNLRVNDPEEKGKVRFGGS